MTRSNNYLLRDLFREEFFTSGGKELARAKVNRERSKDAFVFVMSMFRALRCYFVGRINSDMIKCRMDVQRKCLTFGLELYSQGDLKFALRKNAAFAIDFSSYFSGSIILRSLLCI